MKTKARTAVIFGLLALLTACNGQWAQSGGGGTGTGAGLGRNRPHAKEDEVQAAFEKMMQAFQSGDLATLDSMFLPNATFVDPPVGPGVFAWSDAKPRLEKPLAGTRANDALSNDRDYHITVNRDIGWISTVTHARRVTEHGIEQGDGAITVIFQKMDDGNYKIVLFHAARFPASPAAAITESPKEASPTKKK